MDATLSYLAPLGILCGALLTAANAGARVTGYGFIALTTGAALFTVLAFLNDDLFGTLSSLALTAVNAVGVRRWLGHVAKAEEGAAAASEASERSRAEQTIAPASSLIGAKVFDTSDQTIGELMEIMLEVDSQRPRYFVIHPAGAPEGEQFVGADARTVRIERGAVRLLCDAKDCQLLESSEWPTALQPPKVPTGELHVRS